LDFVVFDQLSGNLVEFGDFNVGELKGLADDRPVNG
jgi:hypothetical protein